jgi:predicted nucleic acid-binding protein
VLSYSLLFDAVLDVIPILPYGLPEARRQADLWAELERKGVTIGPHDMVIAATALAGGFAVAAVNRREFERVPGLELISTKPFVPLD